MFSKKAMLFLAAVLCAAALVAGTYVEPAAAAESVSIDPQLVALAVGFGAFGTVLDVFKQDPFKVLSLTDAINKVPFVPGRAGMLIPWQEQGVATTTIMLEEYAGELKLVNPTPRGGPGETTAKPKRVARTLTIPHYEVDDAVYAEEVQGVRAFGQETVVQTVRGMVDQRMADHVQLKLDPTLEYQRLGAVKGIILNGDGSTLYDLFTEFGVVAETEIDFDLDNGSPAKGALRKACAGVVRKVADNLGGIPFVGLHAFCGDAFFDDLLAHGEVIDSYKNTPMAQVLREGYVYPNNLKVYGAFEFGGIVWENYRGKVGATSFVHTDKCHIFPVGTPGLFRTVYAPADYIETVNTPGLPRYARVYEMHNGKGVHLEVQMNALSYCTRPKSLIGGRRT
jgi:hypothetical protein